LTQHSFQFAFQHLLGGQAGPIIESHGTVSFTTTKDLLYSISGHYEVTQQLWTSIPPYLNVDAAYSGYPGAQDPFPLQIAYSSDGSAVDLDVPYQKAWNSYSSLGSVGLLKPGPTYSLSFNAGLQSREADGGAAAAGILTIHLNLWGDFNDDGSIGFDDLLALAQHYGGTGPDVTYANGCMNADGSIAFDDLLLLAQHDGESFPSTQTAISPVPEPVLVLLVVGPALVARRRVSA
jgi:hypothetical protein